MMDVACPARGSQPWWDRFRVALPLVALLIVCGVGTGCYTSLDDKPEKPLTPLDCDKSKGQYYDFHTQQCVRAATETEALILNRYRYLYELTIRESAGDSSVRYRIDLPSWLSADEVTHLFADSRLQFVRFSAHLTGELRDVVIGLPADLEPPIDFDEAMEQLIEKYGERSTAEVSDKQKHLIALSTGGCKIASMDVVGAPTDALKWWSLHQSQIRSIQALVTPIDKLSPVIPPNRELP